MAPGTVFRTFHFLCNLQMDLKYRVLHYVYLEGLATDKDSSLLGPFVSYKKMNCSEYGSWGRNHNT